MKQTSSSLLFRFEAHLRDRHFFAPRQKILVACSGGPDSIALAHLLQALASQYGWKISLIHFNHQLRPRAAKSDADFVRRLAKRSRIPFYGGVGDVGSEARRTQTSIEECARKMRYDFFLRTAKEKKIPVIALAHTQDDQAETVLMRVIQGTGLRGLQGIREKARMGKVVLARPLLGFTKKELLSYLTRKKIPYRSDQSNNSSRFVRNRIRLELIPSLCRDFNPRVVEALSRIPAIVAEESALITELEEKAWRKAFKKKSASKLELNRTVFLKFPQALQFRIVEKALKKMDPRSGLSFDAWERLRKGLRRSRFRCSLPKDIDLALTPKNITLYKK